MGFKTSALIATTSVLMAGAPAFAANLTFHDGNPNGNMLGGINNVAGTYKSLTATFDTDTDLFSWSSTFEKNSDGTLADGAWLVVSDGPNPKFQPGEYAIYYLDAINEKVSIYEYDGNNNGNSWRNPGNFLDSTSLQVTRNGSDEVTFAFDYDATDLNNLALGPDWKGTSFGEEIGLWFHALSGTGGEYGTDPGDLVSTGNITKFSHKKHGWYDIDSVAVPEPMSVASIGLFALAGVFVKRNKRSA